MLYLSFIFFVLLHVNRSFCFHPGPSPPRVAVQTIQHSFKPNVPHDYTDVRRPTCRQPCTRMSAAAAAAQIHRR
jgi:hypothetical protein